jgi:hypothetical protein
MSRCEAIPLSWLCMSCSPLAAYGLWIFFEAVLELETRVTELEDSHMDNTQEVVDATPPNAII